MRTVIIGIDGVPYDIMKDLSDRGIMPNFKSLREKGIFKKMQAPIPEISSISWSSMITGKNPGEHGIFGFMETIDNSYSLRFPNFESLKQKPFWKKQKGKSVIINVPSTYPAKPMDGFLVSGFVALDLKNSVYPKKYIEKLKDMDYKIDVDSQKGHKSKLLFLKDVFETLDSRVKLGNYMWDEIDWETFMFVITGSDRLMHFLYEAYDDEDHKHHEDFLNYFKKVDEAIGKFLDKMKKDDNLIMISDHGFEKLETDVYVNNVLKENGFLEMDDEPKKRYKNIKKGSKAFALDPGRIFINLKDKYPKGSVDSKDKEKVMKKITEIFENLEKSGKKVIKKVYRKQDLYEGPYTENAADLILLSNPGFNLRGSLGKDEVFSKEVFTGKHRQDNAFLFVNTENKDLIPKNPKVRDVVRIMNKLKGDENYE